MVNEMINTQKAARKAIESTYKGVCTIVERQDMRDEKTKITRKNEEVLVAKNQPCKLSYEKLNAVQQTETAANIMQGVKLFIAPEIKIKNGSKIIIEQNGIKSEYALSGVPAVYPTHQEIILELSERRS